MTCLQYDSAAKTGDEEPSTPAILWLPFSKMHTFHVTGENIMVPPAATPPPAHLDYQRDGAIAFHEDSIPYLS